MPAINRCSVATASPAKRLVSRVIPGIHSTGVLKQTTNHRMRMKAQPCSQRTYQELKQIGEVVKKKTFAGNGLEIIEKPGTGSIQKIHYLTGGDGTLFVKGGLNNSAGYDFWDGSKSDEFVVGSTQNEKIANGYNSSNWADENDELLHLRMKDEFGVSERDFNIRNITTKTENGYGLTNSGECVNLESKNLVAGYARKFTSGYCDVHISPCYSIGNAIDFRAIAGHELIDAYHNYVFLM